MHKLLRDHPDVHCRKSWISLARAIHAVLANKDQRVRQPIQSYSEAATLFAEHLLVSFQLVFVFRECGHCFTLSRFRVSCIGCGSLMGLSANKVVPHRAHAISSKLYPTGSAEHNHSRPKIFLSTRKFRTFRSGLPVS
jgi:hypothetical protein